MMMSEFTERTKYEPSFKEYAEIEEAYYEFDGNKDEFCKYFMKELKAGRWEKEYQLRLKIREMSETIGAQKVEIAEKDRAINDYAGQVIGLRADNKILRNRIESEEKKHPRFAYIALA